MPVQWKDDPAGVSIAARNNAFREGAGPVLSAVLSPNRSLPPTGFAWTMLLAFGMILIPLLPLLGSPVVWGLLPFLMSAIWLLWVFLRRNYRDGYLREELRLWSDRIEIRRTDPGGAIREWSADPYWIRIEIHEDGGPVSDYITLSGSGRRIELGAFLSPEERKALFDTLTACLARIR